MDRENGRFRSVLRIVLIRFSLGSVDRSFELGGNRIEVIRFSLGRNVPVHRSRVIL